MERIILENVVKYFGDRKILEIAEWKVSEGEKIGIVGNNGIGKSTLLNLIAGKVNPDSGTIKVKGDLTYIEQIEESNENLSSGEKRKQQINRSFQSNSAIILADEPSSHLDIKAREYLEKQLEKFKGTLLMISHDRQLLDAVCNSIIEIEKGKIKKYKGNYSEYQLQKEHYMQRKQFEYSQYVQEKQKLEKAIHQTKNTAKRMKKTPSRMGNSEARLHKREAENKKEKIEKHSKALEARLNQLEEKERPEKEYHIYMRLPENREIKSKYVLTCENLSLQVGSKILLQDVKFQIFTNSKTVLIGENGCGKTSLLKRIIQNDKKLIWNPNVKIGYYDQEFQNLDENMSILENVLENSSYSEIEIRNILANMNIKGKEVEKRVSVLSGGEKAKVSLAKILTSDSNFLILDEPTNFLDIVSIEAVQKMIKNYMGTVLLVTHDRRLIDSIATHILLVEDKKIVQFEGNYSQYLESKRQKDFKESNEQLLLKMKLAQLDSQLAFCKDEKKKEKLEEQYWSLKEILDIYGLDAKVK